MILRTIKQVTMKKYSYILMAIAAFMLAACAKEENAPIEEKTSEPELIDEQGELIEVLATFKDEAITKSQYTENDGVYEFSWSRDAEPYEGSKYYKDEIHLLVVNNDSKLDRLRFYADEAKKETKFSGYSMIGAFTSLPQTGFALYPVETVTYGNNTGIRRKDYLTYNNGVIYNDVVTVNLSAEYNLGTDPDMNTQLSCTPLIGNKVGDTNEYEFSTAVGVLKITLTNVPTTATGLRITSPSTDAPLCGTFELVRGTPDIAMSKKVTGGQSRTISFALTTPGEKTFYIPVPTGTIPTVDGKGLQIELLDGSSYPIFSRRYKKELTITRNTIIPVTMETPAWKKLGTGKFMDTHLWGKMGFGTNTFDEVGAVDVVFYQNTSDHTQYRIANPYGQASAFLAAESKSQGEHDDYLSFVVPTEGNVSFTDHKTGYSVSGENITIKYVSSEHNKVVAGTSSAPKIIQLAPDYKGTASFDHDCSAADNKLQIIFPAALEAYGGSASIKDNKADLSSGIDYSKGASAEKLCVYLSDTPIFDYFSSSTNSTHIATGPGSRSTKDNGSNVSAATLGYGASGSSYDQTKSGAKYLIWSTWNDNTGNILYMVGCKKFYGIVPNDVTKMIGDTGTGTYSFNAGYGLFHYYRYAWVDIIGHDTDNLVLQVSDDPTKGNVKLIKIFGFGCDGSYSSYIVNHVQDGDGWNDGDGTENVASDLTGTFGAGSALYGTYTSSDTKLVFTDALQSPFITYTGTHSGTNKKWNLYVGARNSSGQKSRDASFGFEFSTDETKATLTVSPSRYLILHFDGSTNTNADNDIIYLNGRGDNTYGPISVYRNL